MDSSQFHTEIVSLFKSTLAAWDWDKNPLEWEGLPQDAEKLIRRIVEDGLKPDDYGGPVRVGLDLSDTPVSGEATVRAQIHLWDEADVFVNYREPLSDQLIRDATECDEGWLLAQHIRAIRKSLEIAEERAVALGWDMTIDPH